MRRYLVLLLAIACSDADRRTNTVVPAGASTPAMMPVASRGAPDTTPRLFDAVGHPLLPLVLTDSCQGEDCSTGSYVAVACLPAQLLANHADDAAIVDSIAVGDSVMVEHRNLVVPSVGVVILRKAFTFDWDIGADDDERRPRPDTVRFRRGDTVYVVQYGELGSWVWSLGGQLHVSYRFWSDAPDHSLGGSNDDSTLAVGLTSPRTEDWWFVHPRHGAAGWWHADGRDALQSPGYMEHWNESCEKIRARAADTTTSH